MRMKKKYGRSYPLLRYWGLHFSGETNTLVPLRIYVQFEGGTPFSSTFHILWSHLPFPARPSARQRKEEAGRALNKAQLITPNNINQSQRIVLQSSVFDPKDFFPDPDQTFQIIPD